METWSGRGGGRDRGLQPYIRAIRSRAPLVRIITLAVLVGAVLLATQRTPAYEASAKLLIKPLPATDTALLDLDLLRDTGDPTRTTQTAAALIDTESAARRASRQLGGGWSAAAVADATDVQVQGESNVLEVVATTDDPDTAARVANAFAESALELRRVTINREVTEAIEQTEAQLQRTDLPGGSALSGVSERLAELQGIRGGDPTIVLSESAFPPTAAGGVPAWLVVVLTAIAGFVLAVGTALLVEMVDSRARDEEDILGSFPAPVLAGVPLLSRRERQAVAARPLELPPRVRESYRTLMVQLDASQGSGPTIAFASASRGDGKTTSALHLALVLLEQGRRVILLDLDLRNQELTRLLGLASSRPLISELLAPGALGDQLTPLIGSGLQALPAPGDLTLASVDALLEDVPSLLAQAASLADCVVVDTPALGHVSDAVRIIPHIGHAIMVARPGNTDKGALATAYELLARTGRIPSGLLVVGARGARSRSEYGEDFAWEPPAPPPPVRYVARARQQSGR
jgi:Mrp family chromosome partitioning ATPase